MNIRSLLPLLPLLLLSAACSAKSSDAASAAPGTPAATPAAPSTNSSAAAERAIAEADIVQLDGGKLYALSKTGTLSIVDVSQTGRLAMLGQVAISGVPFEMYLRGERMIVMTNKAIASDGSAVTPVPINGRVTAKPSVATDVEDDRGGAGVVSVDISNPRSPNALTTFPVPGEIADSRIVGDVLYLVTYETSSCYLCGTIPRTVVTSFAIGDSGSFRQVEMLSFEDEDNIRNAWGATSYKRSVYANDQRLYIGGHSELAPSYSGAGHEGAIDVLDITDPNGHFRPVVRFATAGAITERWQMDERDGIFRVVTQHGAGYAANGVGSPVMETFNVGASFTANGVGTIELPRQEGLKSVRFDGARAYAITFAESDPLFVLDFSDPTNPKQRGQLHMPGFLFHLEPVGDRMVALGVDRTDMNGHLNVSLLDVSNVDQPKMLQRVSFGAATYASNQNIATYELPEDQDRIQKAFRVLDGGLIVAPFAGALSSPSAGRDDVCTDSAGGVQLIAWKGDALEKNATLPVTGNPRRALLNQGELLAVSDSHVTAFDMSHPEAPSPSADLVIGNCEPRSLAANSVPVVSNNLPRPSFVMNEGGMNDRYDCTMGRGSAPRSPSTGFGLAALGLFIGAALRRRSQARGDGGAASGK